jgi:hypothetical protein
MSVKIAPAQARNQPGHPQMPSPAWCIGGGKEGRKLRGVPTRLRGCPSLRYNPPFQAGNQSSVIGNRLKLEIENCLLTTHYFFSEGNK